MTPLDQTIDRHPGMRRLILEHMARATSTVIGDRVAVGTSRGIVRVIDCDPVIKYPGYWIEFEELTEWVWWVGEIRVLQPGK